MHKCSSRFTSAAKTSQYRCKLTSPGSDAQIQRASNKKFFFLRKETESLNLYDVCAESEKKNKTNK